MDRESDNASYDLVIRQSIITKEVGGTTMMKGVVELIYLVIVERGLWGKGILLLLCDELKKQIVQE